MLCSTMNLATPMCHGGRSLRTRMVGLEFCPREPPTSSSGRQWTTLPTSHTRWAPLASLRRATIFSLVTTSPSHLTCSHSMVRQPTHQVPWMLRRQPTAKTLPGTGPAMTQRNSPTFLQTRTRAQGRSEEEQSQMRSTGTSNSASTVVSMPAVCPRHHQLCPPADHLSS